MEPENTNGLMAIARHGIKMLATRNLRERTLILNTKGVKQGLKPKDLINVGIFSAIYIIIVMAAAMLGYIPIFIPLLVVICPIVGGIPYMLYMTKVHCFGMVTIMGIIMGVLMGLGGMGLYALITGPLFGLLADFVLKSGGYHSPKKAVLSHGIFSMWLIGNYIPIVINRASYFDGLVQGYGQAYAETLMGYIPDWSLVVLLAGAFVFGIVGALLGKAVFHKHFARAGIV